MASDSAGSLVVLDRDHVAAPGKGLGGLIRVDLANGNRTVRRAKRRGRAPRSVPVPDVSRAGPRGYLAVSAGDSNWFKDQQRRFTGGAWLCGAVEAGGLDHQASHARYRTVPATPPAASAPT